MKKGQTTSAAGTEREGGRKRERAEARERKRARTRDQDRHALCNGLVHSLVALRLDHPRPRGRDGGGGALVHGVDVAAHGGFS